MLETIAGDLDRLVGPGSGFLRHDGRTQLPEVSPDVKAWVARVAPELAQVPVRELSEKRALEAFGRAAAAGWGGIDLFTDGVFRESCVLHLQAGLFSPQSSLRPIRARGAAAGSN